MNNYPLIGEMNAPAQLQRNTPTPVGAGFKDNYTEILRTRGKLEKKTGRRVMDSGEILIYSFWVFECRFQAAIENEVEKKSMRWVINNRFFTIDSYELIDQKPFYYRFNLNEEE